MVFCRRNKKVTDTDGNLKRLSRCVLNCAGEEAGGMTLMGSCNSLVKIFLLLPSLFPFFLSPLPLSFLSFFLLLFLLFSMGSKRIETHAPTEQAGRLDTGLQSPQGLAPEFFPPGHWLRKRDTSTLKF